MLRMSVGPDWDTVQRPTAALPAGSGNAGWHGGASDSPVRVCFACEQDQARMQRCCKCLPHPFFLTWLHSLSLLALNSLCSLSTLLPCPAPVPRGVGASDCAWA